MSHHYFYYHYFMSKVHKWTKNIQHLDFELGLSHSTDGLQFLLFFCKWHNFIFLYDWGISHGVFIYMYILQMYACMCIYIYIFFFSLSIHSSCWITTEKSTATRMSIQASHSCTEFHSFRYMPNSGMAA
jgi:hypothetical protein